MPDELPASYGGGASSSSRRGFSPCQRDSRFELLQVEPDPPRLQSQKVAVDDEEAGHPVAGAFFPQGLPELVQDGAQVRAGATLLALWPQKLCELSPRVPSPLGDQVAQERELLLYLEPDGQPPKARLRRPQQPEAQPIFFWDFRLESHAPRFRYAPLLWWLVRAVMGVGLSLSRPNCTGFPWGIATGSTTGIVKIGTRDERRNPRMASAGGGGGNGG